MLLAGANWWGTSVSVLHVRLLGSPDIRVAEQILSFRNRKALALMIYLIVEKGRHFRDHLSTLFWPNSDTVHARTALRSALAMLREALEAAQPDVAASYLLVDRETIGFVTDTLDLDLYDFQSSLEAIHELRKSRTLSPNIPTLLPVNQQELIQKFQHGIALYRGEFLQGFSLPDAPAFEDWAGFQRESYHRHVSMLFDYLNQLELDSGQLPEATDIAARWISHDPLDETAHLWLMQARLAAGDRMGAFRAYESLRTVLKRELGATPGAEIEALAAHIREGVPRLVGHPRDMRPSQVTTAAAINGPLVGRTNQYGLLIRSYWLAQQQGPQVVVLIGEAGIGKTRLASEYLGWATAQGADVLQGCAFEVGGRLPYQPLVDLLRVRLDQERAPDDLLSDVWLAELSRLLPELCERYPDLSHAVIDEATARTRLFEAVVCLGQALAARKPLVLFVDDLHWADVASCDLLFYAIRRWTESALPVLVLLGVRKEALAVQHDLDLWLSNLQRMSALTYLVLEPFSAQDMRQLIQALSAKLPEQHESLSSKTNSFAEWLFVETAGQPLYVIETLQALIEQGYVATQMSSAGEITIDLDLDLDRLRSMHGYLPHGVRNLIRGRLLQISVQANILLASAAVLGQRFAFDDLRRVADMNESDSLMALDEALQSNLLKEPLTSAVVEPDYYMFVHDKIRTVIYAELSEARRRVFHRRAFEMLGEHAAPADMIRHAFQAGLLSDAVKASIAAADKAMAVFAIRDAISYYEQAQHLLQQHAPDPAHQVDISISQRWHLWASLGRAYVVSADWHAAQLNYTAMLAFARSCIEPIMECEALVCLANVALHQSFDLKTASALLQQALTVAQTSAAPAALAQTEWNLAQSGYYAWDLAESLAHAERAFNLARDQGLAELSARSLYAMAHAQWRLGHWEASKEHALAAYDIYHSHADRAMQCSSLHLLGRAQIHLGDPLAGISSTRAAYDISVEIGHVWATIQSASTLCVGLREIGDYAEAIRFGQAALTQARLKQNPVILLMSLGALGTTLQEALQLNEARIIFRDAQALGDSIALRPYAALVASMHCAVAAMLEKWDEATEWALRALKARDPSSLHLTDWSRCYETEALLRGGYATQAQEDVHRFGDCVASNRRYRIPYLRTLAVLARWEAHYDQALLFLWEALDLASAIGLPGEQWRIAQATGEIYLAQGQQQAAQTAVANAASIVASLSESFADEARRSTFLSSPFIQRLIG